MSLALYKARQFYDVVCLVTVIPENPNVQFTKIQSEAIGLPLVDGKTKGEKETGFEDLKRILI